MMTLLRSAVSSALRLLCRADPVAVRCCAARVVSLSSAMPKNPVLQVPEGWSLTSWTTKPVLQDVTYPDEAVAKRVYSKLERLPPLVHVGEIERLKQQLAEVQRHERFLLQGGDCAEIFDYCSSEPIENKLKILLQMSLILTWGGKTPVVRIARMGGQYAKPRSKPTEIVDNKEILSFRGENVNGFDSKDRIPDPERLLSAYFHSAATINYVRALLRGGFADLHHPSDWSLAHIRNPVVRAEYEQIVLRLTDALDFMRTISGPPASTHHSSSLAANSSSSSSSALESSVAAPTTDNNMSTVDLFMSHEGLLLEYEQSLTRAVVLPDGRKRYYNLGAHFLWIGDRTRQLDGAHIEYFRGIANPIGIKVGPSMKPQELVELVKKLDPFQEPGRITLITRYGVGKIRDHLPVHIKAIQEAGLKVVWCCDPMHGNTETARTTGLKTRHFDNIMGELASAFSIHKESNSKLCGVHFELTGDPNITECIGGNMELEDKDLSLNYQTFCDPRLNYEQSLDIAFLIAKYYEEERSILKKASMDN